MNQTFRGIFTGSKFNGTFTGRCGQILVEDGDHRLEIYCELGSKGVIIGSVPYKWKIPAGQTLTEQQQLEILDFLKAWLRANDVPNDLTDEPWMSAPDERDSKCAWARCENPRVLGYAICRDHIRRGYIRARLDSPSNQEGCEASRLTGQTSVRFGDIHKAALREGPQGVGSGSSPHLAQAARNGQRFDGCGFAKTTIGIFNSPSPCEDLCMTTRQCLNRRFFRGCLWLIASVFVLGVLQYGVLGREIDGMTIKEAGVLAFVGIVYYRWLTPCLNCRRSLKWFALSWRPASAPLTSPRCPYCAVSIDHDTAIQQ